jgi:hypothetical protein
LIKGGLFERNRVKRIMRIMVALISLAVALSFPLAVQAKAAPYEKFGLLQPPVYVASGSCVDTTVRLVAPRLDGLDPAKEHFTRQEFIDSGVAVTFNTKLGTLNHRLRAEVVHYQQEPGNNIMMNERVGDRVRVCFLGGPKADRACDPNTDLRGRKFSVYDYRQHASYSGMNSEHGCGGA